MPWTAQQRTGRLRRWWHDSRAGSPPARSEGRRRRSWPRRALRITLAAAVLGGAGWGIVARMQAVPRVEPPFERLVGPGAGPVKELDLPDLAGRVHTAADWAGRPAAVLTFLGPDCPVSRDCAAALDTLAREFEARGILFLAIDPTPEMTPEVAAKSWAGRTPAFPVLLDGRHRVVRQAGVEATPTAVVVLPDGQVIYRGPIDDRIGTDGQRRSATAGPLLRATLEAILGEEMPAETFAKTHGTPIAPVPAESLGEGERITFNKHIAPILWNNCARCHRPGNVGPFSLLTYRDARKRADFIREVTESGQMPPWKAHPGAGVFLDAPRLSVLEKETLARWAETGCAEGDPADLPPSPKFPDGWELGPPDLVLTMPEPLDLPAGGYDMYRAFAIPVPLDHPETIVGVEFHPGNRRIVHHSRIHLDETGDARRREQDDPGPGFAGWRGRTVMELPYPGLGGWTPGMTPRFTPEGSGRALPPGSDIVVQVHYHPSGKPESDRSSVGLYFARQPLTRRMAGFSICTDRIDIPPGAKRHMLIQAARLKTDVRLYTIVPHAHYLCREFRLAATLPDGTVRPLLWIQDWDFDWQDQYRFARPLKLPRGTILTFAAYFDNTENNPRNPNKPPRRVRYGVESQDEMCACHLEFLPEGPGAYEAYPGKSPFGL
ncbi:MAG: redoxin domain-containing protein [Isosphaeraceae bacterium]